MAELIAAIAARRGSAPALIDEFGETDWPTFDERVNRLVSALRDRGLAPTATFALLSGNRREAFEAHAAAAHGSWVLVPVNWHWTDEELAYVLGDADADALIVDGRFADVKYKRTPDPGVWRPTPPGFVPFFDPWLGKMRPFTLDANNQFQPGPPPALSAGTPLVNRVVPSTPTPM